MHSSYGENIHVYVQAAQSVSTLPWQPWPNLGYALQTENSPSSITDICMLICTSILKTDWLTRIFNLGIHGYKPKSSKMREATPLACWPGGSINSFLKFAFLHFITIYTSASLVPRLSPKRRGRAWYIIYIT